MLKLVHIVVPGCTQRADAAQRQVTLIIRDHIELTGHRETSTP